VLYLDMVNCCAYTDGITIVFLSIITMPIQFIQNAAAAW